MALTFYNYGRDSQCVVFSLQESGQITNTPLGLDTTKHSRYITLHHAVHAKVKTPCRPPPTESLSNNSQRNCAFRHRDEFIVIFLNLGTTFNMISKHRHIGFSVELILAWHTCTDPASLVIDLLNRFSAISSMSWMLVIFAKWRKSFQALHSKMLR